MGCCESKQQNKSSPIEIKKAIRDVTSPTTGETEAKTTIQQSSREQAPVQHSRPMQIDQTSSTSISEALDLASLRQQMVSDGDIAKTVVRIEVNDNHTQSRK